MYAFILSIVTLLMRVYGIDSYTTFLGDQGRDMIVLKRIITLEHFPGIGASSSVGQVFLGPFYYYVMAPWLLFSNLNPVGPAIGIAVLSSLSIFIIFLILRKIYNEQIGLITVMLLTFSPILLEYGRFSWNPNLLPYTAILFFGALYYALQKHNIKFFFIAGILLSINIQFHYIALTLIPATIVLSLLFVKKYKAVEIVKMLTSFCAGLIIVLFPLIIFDIRHDFINTKNLFTILFNSETISRNNIDILQVTIKNMHQYLFIFNGQNIYLVIFALVVFLNIAYGFFMKDKKTLYIVLFTLLLIIGVSLYSGPKYSHYIAITYIFYLILFANIFSILITYNKKFIVYVILSIYCIGMLYYSFKNLYKPHYNQINHARQVAKIIKNHITTDKFQVTGFPDQYSDGTYRYFLEILGKRPIDKDSLLKAQELFVICEGTCSPIGNPQWDIAYFAPRKVVSSWKYDRVTIYKLTR